MKRDLNIVARNVGAVQIDDRRVVECETLTKHAKCVTVLVETLPKDDVVVRSVHCQSRKRLVIGRCRVDQLSVFERKSF